MQIHRERLAQLATPITQMIPTTRTVPFLVNPSPEGGVVVPLEGGLFTVIDAEDEEKISTYSWCADKGGGETYYVTAYAIVSGKSTRVRMHRIIMGAKRGEIIDHEDRNGLNNRKSNLRRATKSQNAMNSKVRTNSTSGCTGVNTTKDGKWRARIMVDYKRVELGLFQDLEEAVRARREAEKMYFGEFRPHREGLGN